MDSDFEGRPGGRERAARGATGARGTRSPRDRIGARDERADRGAKGARTTDSQSHTHVEANFAMGIQGSSDSSGWNLDYRFK
jgi:hypothetical protein